MNRVSLQFMGLTAQTRLAYCQSDPWSRGQAAAYCCPCDGEQAWRGRGQKRWNVGRRPPSTPLRSTSAHPLLQPLARMLRRIGNRSPSRQQFVPRRTTTPGKLREHCALQVESPVHPSLPFAIFLVMPIGSSYSSAKRQRMYLSLTRLPRKKAAAARDLEPRKADMQVHNGGLNDV